jgi:hypothetical protein
MVSSRTTGHRKACDAPQHSGKRNEDGVWCLREFECLLLSSLTWPDGRVFEGRQSSQNARLDGGSGEL